jgi:peptide/nickel transport system substrate-binding protein
MPERIAKTDPFKQITDPTGSGPFKFVKDDWIAGARAAWVKNDKYVPRDEPADFYAGGKRVYVDRVEHTVMPDGATAAAALQTGEVDWVHVPLIDLVPMLKKSPGVAVAVYDPLGWLGIIRPNFLFPPFDNRKLLRAILPAIDQREFLAAVIGEQSDLGKLPAGFFTVGSAMANLAGIDALTGPARCRKGEAAGRRKRLQGRACPADVADRSACIGADRAGDAFGVREGRHQGQLRGDGLVDAGRAPRIARAAR